MKQVAVPAPLALLAFIAMGDAQLECEPLVLDAHEFRVVDDQGKVDAVFRLSESEVKLKMIGPDGVERASLWVAGDGFPQRSLSNDRGKIATSLGVFFSHPSIVVNSERRTEAELSMLEDAPELTLLRHKGDARTELMVWGADPDSS